jgi:hypothetical protein
MPRYSLARRVEFAKKYQLRIEIVPGAETRGYESYNPGCYVGHHTAGAKTGDRPSLNLCVNGREDLGLGIPLCEDFMPRMGGLVIVACGRSNNAGLGGFRGIVGNSGVMGCEAEDDGDGIWTSAQWRDYPRIVASGLDMLGLDASWYCSHRTWALVPPSWPGRKIDPTGITDAWMQAWVRVLHANPKAVPRQGFPTAADLEGNLVLDTTDKTWITNELKRVGLRVGATLLTGGANTIITAEEAKPFANISMAHAVYMLMYGDHADDTTDPQTHPNNLQRIRLGLEAFKAASDARETALIDLVTKLAQAEDGTPISKEEIVATLDAAVERGFGDLDLRLVAGPPVIEGGTV